MRYLWKILSVFGFLAMLVSCNRMLPFAEYERNYFPETAITRSETKIIKLSNPDESEPQHIRAIAFDGGGNEGGHFVIEQVTVGGRPVDTQDLQVPPGGNMALHVTYHPTSLETTKAEFGNWETGGEYRFEPHAPALSESASESSAADAQTAMLGGSDEPAYDETHDIIHRALLVLTYDHPREGVMRIELVGTAVAGPNGEVTSTGLAPAASVGECPAGTDRACFVGTIGLSLPDLLDTEFTTELQGPWLMDIADGTVTAPMKDFPVAIFLVEGGGLPTISIAITGDEATETIGKHGEEGMSLDNAAFRVRVIMGAVSVNSLASASPLADFVIRDVALSTVEPDGNEPQMLNAEVTLADAPSGNPLVDGKLGGAKIVVNIRGELTLP